MATTWSITNMVTLPDVQGQINYVWNVMWKCAVTDSGEITSMISTVVLDPETTSNPYVPYNQLTEAQVVQWVKDKLGAAVVAKVEAQLLAELQSVVLPLPWSA